MDTASLKPFAREARRQLLDQVGARLEHVLRADSAELREKKKTLGELQEQIDLTSKRAVIDRVAYTWFNRFCALRFMDVNHYTRVGIVSPAEGRTQPEVLQDAKQGLVGDWLKVDHQRVLDLLSGKATSSNRQQEAYRLLLVGACNAYHDQMPFLFQPIEDYTELLMPDDLLSENSVLQAVREALTREACRDVEVIGWLYQYYISERKDEVFANLKQNKKIQPEDIPAATQLFTPHWIVRYLVENSLGRLWMLNHPESKLVEQMEYYIQPEQEETDFLKIGSPEEIKVCDPACGSGHMLTYAFDLLYALYEEQGYDPEAIPSRILEKNLYGIEIDERAGHLTAFALMMKARERDRRFFNREAEPNICVLENVAFTEEELDAYMDAVGRDLFTQDLKETLTQFERADNFGSLIQPKVRDVAFIRQRIEEQEIFEDLFLHRTNQKVLKVLEQAEYLSPGYHVVVANPPYMGAGGMNAVLKRFAESEYRTSKSDTYAMFIERNLGLLLGSALLGMITIPNWMFLKSFEDTRMRILNHCTLLSLVHNGRGVWGSDFGSCSFVIKNHSGPTYQGQFRRLFLEKSKVASNEKLRQRFFDLEDFPQYRAAAQDFLAIPGAPIAYWVSENIRDCFAKMETLGHSYEFRIGMATGNNDEFVRAWHEVAYSRIGFGCQSREEAKKTRRRWFPYTKGGTYRKWAGNELYVVDWENDGHRLQTTLDPRGKRIRAHNFNLDEVFSPAICWTSVTSAQTSFRLHEGGFLFDAAGGLCQARSDAGLEPALGLLNSSVAKAILPLINSSINVPPGYLSKIPFFEQDVSHLVEDAIRISRLDWEQFETSWAFLQSPLLCGKDAKKSVSREYSGMREAWIDRTKQMQTIEHAINVAWIDGYSLSNDLNSAGPPKDVTLFCNPQYRYPGTRSKTYTDEEREAMLLEDTMKEFISYAVGCMFGRYSLDKPGLILANQGETSDDYRKLVSDPTFPPDEDNVIPILDEGWFADDIAERFKQFLQVTFGTENYEENLAFLEAAIGKDIRSYFLKSFYGEHVKMYKKRPIYWLFSSPNGSFNALIYMHRYRPDTLSIILNDYLRQYHEKLRSHRERLEQVSISPNANRSEKTKALKEIDKVSKVLAELKVYEDEILYPLAAKQVEIDLDDGVKVNYNKFGKALKHVSGLSQ